MTSLKKWAAVVLVLVTVLEKLLSQDIIGCGGFVQSNVPISFERVQIKLYTRQGAIKFSTECAPNNGYFLVAVYDKGDYILKIEPPAGWGFAPSEIQLLVDGLTDQCSKGEDINFKFIGFSIYGLIGSLGRSQGPAGVSLVLRNQDGVEVDQGATEEGGRFSFRHVMPGRYVVKASHPSWSFSKDQLEILVNSDNVETVREISIAGYDVRGSVLSGGERIQGVSFILLSSTVNKMDLTKCESIPDALLTILPDHVTEMPLCCAISSADGEFTFPIVPSGDYVLVPMYVADGMAFDIVPSKIGFTVNYRSVILQTPFQVYGFSVGGKVVDSMGVGIADVQVIALNEKQERRVAMSRYDGSYLLENVTTGSYIFKFLAEHIFFNDERIYITPNSPTLHNFVAQRYSVCGAMRIVNIPSGSLSTSQRKLLLQPTSSSNMEMKTRNADASGKFCFEVVPGIYKIEPIIMPHERKSGFLLKPSHLDFEVVNKPILNLLFAQFLATVSGKLDCLGSCQDASVYLTSTDKGAIDKVSSQVDKDNVFLFSNILPGNYKVVPVKKKWCWNPRNLEIDIADSNITDLRFAHDGYFMKCSISHSITLNFRLESKDSVVGTFNLSKGTNRFCLKIPGVYELTPESCFKFEQEKYYFDTFNPISLTLSVVAYQLLVKVFSEVPATDMRFAIRSMSAMREEVIGALGVWPDIMTHDGQRHIHVLTDFLSPPQNSSIKLHWAVFWGKLAEEFLVTPLSKEVLFQPKEISVTLEGKCPGGIVEFHGHRGKFIEGSITPPLPNVHVTVSTFPTAKHEARQISVFTDDSGKYRLGPFHSDVEYEVAALKEGYHISSKDVERESFVAIQLGGITVKVADEMGNPMSAVLLSVSGGQYRNNNLTAEDGSLSFGNLRPGNYFMRPMQKEYSFEPASKLIEIREGERVLVMIKGKRVAFSCFGATSSLSGFPEENVIVEARGLDSCSNYHEESASDERGFYRLRGLQPGCSYAVQMVKSESNDAFGRSTPAKRIVKIDQEDISNVNFIVFAKQSSLQLTAYVDTSLDLLQTLKVFLFDEENLDSPIHTVVPDVVKYIQFPPLKLKAYVVRIESSLSPKTHIIKSTSATVANDGSLKKHVHLKFDAKERKLDMEPTQSVIALPLAVALLFICYNYDTAWILCVRISFIFRSLIRPDERTGELSDDDNDDSVKLSKKKKR